MVRAACADSSVLAVVAIGSAVRGATVPHDVDFVLVHAPNAAPNLGAFPLDVDLRSYDASTVDENLGAGHELLGWAVQFGVPICERNQYWRSVTGRWLHRIPLPSADRATERARRARHLTEELRAIGDVEAAAEQYVSWLTHDARARLIHAGVYPASRPELSEQLRQLGAHPEADTLESALADRLRMSAA